MGDERLSILRMVASGRISPEEGERLLELISDPLSELERLTSSLTALIEQLDEIKNHLSQIRDGLIWHLSRLQAVKALSPAPAEPKTRRRAKKVERSKGKLMVKTPPGAILFIEKSGGRVEIGSHDLEELWAAAKGDEELDAICRGEFIELTSGQSHLKVNVPASAQAVNLSMEEAELITAQGLECDLFIRVKAAEEISIKSLKGELSIRSNECLADIEGCSGEVKLGIQSGQVTASDLEGGFTLKGGRCDLELSGFKGDVYVALEGGDITLIVPRDYSCQLQAGVEEGVVKADLEGIKGISDRFEVVRQTPTSVEFIKEGGDRSVKISVKSGTMTIKPEEVS